MSEVAGDFWTTLPLGREVKLVHRDVNGVAALLKPAGVLSHPNEGGDEPRSLLTVRYEKEGEFFEWSDAAGQVRRLWLLNRLDSATSGVILAAADAELAAEVRAGFKRKQVRKIYYALVFGRPRQAMELWRDLLAVEKRAGQIRTSAHAGKVPAECRMSLVRAGRNHPPIALVRLEPRTGRSHQLRVQCAKRHLPMIGDQTYGKFTENREFAKKAGTKRLFLHSMETSFEYEWKGHKSTFTAKAPLPREFEEFL